jgi:predicted permease
LNGQTPPADPNDRPLVGGIEVSQNYFQVLGVPIRRGRDFVSNEGRQGEKVAIINQRFTEKYLSGKEPIGQRIGIVRETKPQLWVTIIGEVGDVKQNVWPNNDFVAIEPVIYVPYLQDQESRQVAIIARSSGDPRPLAVPLRDAIQRVNDMSVRDVLTLPEHFTRTRWFNRVFSSLFTIFAFIGLVLAVVGIYAVMAYSVSQRTREIGIRMTFGARQSSIVKMIVSRGLRLAIAGIVIGLVGAFALTRTMKSFLAGVSPTDPLTYVAVALLLIVVAVVACFLPARRAANINPILAIRAD